MGKLCMLQQRPEEARSHWLGALDARPEDETALLLMSQFEDERGRFPEAIAYLRRFDRINPWMADFQGRMAQLLWQSGDRDGALVAAQRGLELDPRLIPLRQSLARAFRQLDRPDDAQVQEDLLERMRGR
ncbi:MAG: tetratricopeptide repeat protein [Planctomycetaceae bacterium]|nr:tetratricopeptide repeat protein [Planctomycetaceae bacterium]